MLEVKGFVVMGGALRSPLYERFELASWPGDAPGAALTAWQEQRAQPVRASWRDAGTQIDSTVRTQQATMQLSLTQLEAAPDGRGPHGALKWRAGTAVLTLDGRALDGVGIVESLRGEVANPRFGVFEMWVAAPSPGTLFLGRSGGAHEEGGDEPGADKPGAALHIDRQGRASLEPFAAHVTRTRAHEESGFALPTAWRSPPDAAHEWTRAAGGEPQVGRTADGAVAVYDIGLATSPQGGVALVFHLRDEKSP